VRKCGKGLGKDWGEKLGSWGRPLLYNFPSYSAQFIHFKYQLKSQTSGICVITVYLYYIAATAYNDTGESGYSNEVSGVPQPDDTTPPADVSAFTAAPGDGHVTLSWINSTDDDFVGTMIRYRTDGTHATDHTEGTAVNNGNDGKFVNSPGSNDSFVHSGLQNGTSYYYSAFAYDEMPNYTDAAHASATPTAEGPPPDTTDPTIAITSPPSGSTYSTEEDTITLVGTASDDVGVRSVTWTNSRGGAAQPQEPLLGQSPPFPSTAVTTTS